MSSVVRLFDSARRVGISALLLVLTSSMMAAQAPSQPAPRPSPDTPEAQYPKVQLTAGRSTVVSTPFDVTRIAVTSPDVADAVVVAPREVLIDGKKPGTVSLIVWGPGTRLQYDVVVEQPITALEQQLHNLFPGEDVTVGTSEGATILSGRVSNTNTMLRIGEIATASLPKAQVINLLQVPGGNESQQVMLQVRFAEVNRRKLADAGLALFAHRENFAARSTTQQYPAPIFDDSKPDAYIFVGTIVAMYAQARGMVEFWIAWLLVDVVGVPLNFANGYAFSGFVYVIYGALVLWGMRDWWLRSRRNARPVLEGAPA